MKIEFFEEGCCDYYGDVIHNHMVCPVCKDEYAGTSEYGAIYDMNINDILECEECGAGFKLIKKIDFYEDWEWEHIK